MKAPMKMVKKGGKSVPAFAADGVGKMKKGGSPKKMQMGGPAGGMPPAQGAMPPAGGPMPQGMPPGMKKGGMADKTGRAVSRKTADVKGRAMKKGA
jgi:hypothetical protein